MLLDWVRLNTLPRTTLHQLTKSSSLTYVKVFTHSNSHITQTHHHAKSYQQKQIHTKKGLSNKI